MGVSIINSVFFPIVSHPHPHLNRDIHCIWFSLDFLLSNQQWHISKKSGLRDLPRKMPHLSHRYIFIFSLGPIRERHISQGTLHLYGSCRICCTMGVDGDKWLPHPPQPLSTHTLKIRRSTSSSLLRKSRIYFTYKQCERVNICCCSLCVRLILCPLKIPDKRVLLATWSLPFFFHLKVDRTTNKSNKGRSVCFFFVKIEFISHTNIEREKRIRCRALCATKESVTFDFSLGDGRILVHS